MARAKIKLSHDGRAGIGMIHGLTLNDDESVILTCRPRLLLKVRMLYEIVRTEDRPDRGPWRVSTRAYMYELQTASGELVWSSTGTPPVQCRTLTHI